MTYKIRYSSLGYWCAVNDEGKVVAGFVLRAKLEAWAARRQVRLED